MSKHEKSEYIYSLLPRKLSRNFIPICKKYFLRALNLRHSRVKGVIKRFFLMIWGLKILGKCTMRNMVNLQLKRAFLETYLTQHSMWDSMHPKLMLTRCIYRAENPNCQDRRFEWKQTFLTKSRIHKLKLKAFFQISKEEKPGILRLSWDCQGTRLSSLELPIPH